MKRHREQSAAQSQSDEIASHASDVYPALPAQSHLVRTLSVGFCGLTQVALCLMLLKMTYQLRTLHATIITGVHLVPVRSSIGEQNYS